MFSNFQKTTDLEYVDKGYSVFIQTDQAIYRPGNEVKFRVLVLSPQLKPTVTGSIDVKMTDGKGHLIRDWNRVFTKQGVFAGELEIAKKPVLGDWNIEVDINEQIFTKKFQVAEYVFPKFQVTFHFLLALIRFLGTRLRFSCNPREVVKL